MKYGSWAGHYLRTLSLFAALWAVVRWALERLPTIPASGSMGKVSTAIFPLLFLVLAGGVLKGRNAYRWTTIALFGTMAAFALVNLALCIAWPDARLAVFLEKPLKPPFLTGIESLFLFLVASPPVVLLLHPEAREAYRLDIPFPPEARAWSHARFLRYGLGAVLLLTLAASYQVSIVRVEIISYSQYFYTDRSWHPGSSGPLRSQVTYRSEVVVRKADQKTLHVLAVHAEVEKMESNTNLSTFRVAWRHIMREDGDIAPSPPPHLSLFTLPAEARGEPNVCLHLGDGSKVLVNRRVTLETLDGVERLANESKTIEEFRLKLETLLPPLDGPSDRE